MYQQNSFHTYIMVGNPAEAENIALDNIDLMNVTL